MKRTPRSLLMPFLGLLLLSQACTSSTRKLDKDKTGKTGGKAAAEGGLPGSVEVTEASLRGKTFRPVPSLAKVHFDYDKAVLSEQNLAALKANAAWLKTNAKVEVQIQGHSDERGTVAYNIALGQKRARAVRDYYRALGIPMGRMSTISYGKENPECQESAEECWYINRRAETGARIREI